ncbi:acyltransferase family protein [Actinokineospora sp. NPDC004072]
MVAELVGTPDGELQRKEPPRRRAPALDGVRGLAAVGVLYLHTSFYAGVTAVEGLVEGVPVLGWLTTGATVVLAPFFLLSGLFLYRPFARATLAGTQTPALKKFFARRLLRILPMYWLVVAVSLLLIGATYVDSFWDVLRPLVMLQYFVDVDTFTPGLEITWSVVTEVIFYLLLPLGAWLIHRARVDDPRRQLRRILWSLAPVVLVGPAWMVYIHLPFMGEYPIESFWPPGYIGLIAIGMMFGALSAYQDVTGDQPAIYRSAVRSPLAWWAGAFAVFLLNCVKPFTVAGTSNYPPMSQAIMDHVLFLAFAVLVMVPLIAPGVRSRVIDGLLCNPVSTFLGKISFGVYLWHFPMLYFALGMGSMFGTEPMLMPGITGLWLLVQVLAGTIVLATVSYYLVERPAARIGGRALKAGIPTAAL